jgi:hypothetical protein
MKSKMFVAAVLLLALLGFPQTSGQAVSKVIPANAKVFVAPMPDGFDEYLKAAIEKKKVPVELVANKDQAEFQITGQAETQKPAPPRRPSCGIGARMSKPASRSRT